MILQGLCKAIHKPSKSTRSFYYRHRALLSKKCKDLKLQRWPLSDGLAEFALTLSECAPAQVDDFQTEREKKAFISLSWAPQDPLFFKMLSKQAKLWKIYSSQSLEEFLHSLDAQEWLDSARNLGRKPLFELDRRYRPSRNAALKNIRIIRDLLRKEPLLRYLDLKEMKIKNAQKIIENFKALPIYRKTYLDRVATSFFEN